MSGVKGGATLAQAVAAKPAADANKAASGADPANIARRFLNGRPHLKCHRGEFFEYDGKNYVRLDRGDIKADLINFMATRGARTGTSAVQSALMNVEARGHVPTSRSMPCWLKEPDRSTRLIAFSNGLIDEEALRSGGKVEIQGHTPDYFNRNSLPFNFDPSAHSAKWESFLIEALPDSGARDLMQEWFGYNLTPDTSQDKALIAVGEGGDGKSVMALVLRDLLGAENCSSVSVEGFNVQRSYLMASTNGKLANIVPDQNHIERAQEGILKSYISGEGITVEEKFKAPYVMYPTARLTICCNALPKFSDRSEGLMRRLLIVLFPRNLAEGDQNKEMRTPAYWRNELPGIFNWAMKGLQRLKDRGQFTVPKSVAEARNEYRTDSNPARKFLQEGFEATGSEDDAVPATRLFKSYELWANSQGLKPLSGPNFKKEVARVFGKRIEHKVVWQGLEGSKQATRCYVGLRQRSSEESEVIEDLETVTPLSFSTFVKNKTLPMSKVS